MASDGAPAAGQSALDRLKAAGTIVVSDSGDFNKLKELKPHDATTNPSLIFAAAKMPEYKHVVDEALAYAQRSGKAGAEQMELLLDRVRGRHGCRDRDSHTDSDMHATLVRSCVCVCVYARPRFSHRV
jgi:transaldolase